MTDDAKLIEALERASADAQKWCVTDAERDPAVAVYAFHDLAELCVESSARLRTLTAAGSCEPSAPLWKQVEEIEKRLMAQIGHPNSVSIKLALDQFANELRPLFAAHPYAPWGSNTEHVQAQPHPTALLADMASLVEKLRKRASQINALSLSSGSAIDACADELSAILARHSAAPDAQSAFPACEYNGTRWQHVKSSGFYRFLGMCRIEATNTLGVAYQSEKDGVIWVRPWEEFFDGRFLPRFRKAVSDGRGKLHRHIVEWLA